MPSSTCSACHALLRSRLRLRISTFELRRRGFHTLPIAQASQKGVYIESRYVDTVPPIPGQLAAATHFFNTHTPSKAWTASEWRKHISQHSDSVNDITPEVVFIGRSNSGKSSLLNAVLSSPGLCRVGPRPGKTVTMHAWSLSRSRPLSASRSSSKGMAATATFESHPKLTVLDMPGYGHGSQTEWGQEIIKYMRRRRQLRRAFVLLNPKHGIKTSDEQILRVLRAEGIAHQIVACKCDDVKASELAARLEELRETVTRSAAEQKALGLVLSDVLAIGNLGDGRANQRVEARNMKGVDNVRWAILQATGLDQYATMQYTESLQQQQQQKRPLRVIGTGPTPGATVADTQSIRPNT